MARALRVINLSKTYNGQKQPIIALKNISFDLDEGDLFCVLGPSGCGKTTLLRCLAGFEQVTEGMILVDGQLVRKPGPDRTMVFQDFNQLLPWKTALENVEFSLKANKIAPLKERKKIAEQLLSVVGLSEFTDNYPHELSGGMKQRVAIARALALKPKVLLMDEPFASLDAQTRNVLQVELIKIWEKFCITIVFITHNIQEAVILGSRIAVMSKQPGTIKKIITNNLDRPRYTGYPGFAEIWSELHQLLDTC